MMGYITPHLACSLRKSACIHLGIITKCVLFVCLFVLNCKKSGMLLIQAAISKIVSVNKNFF